ncbi:MAG: cupin domain-containing protein [Methanomassiliicoccales archaeon]|nr:MAG: cupin domain-containing protein [Methanomassiliicoccales archaeon]
MIVKKEYAKKVVFLGISFDVLSVGEKSMVTKMNYKAGDHVSFHSHPHEQSGYVISGKIRMKFGQHNEILQAGDSYSIPGGVKHSINALEDSKEVTFFSPPREDYL